MVKMTMQQMQDDGANEDLEEVVSNEDKDFEYVRLPLEITKQFYSDTIHLKIQSEGSERDVELKKEKIWIGRDSICDIQLENNCTARIHASFLYEDNAWFIIDNCSMNGTFLNDKRLKPNIKYELQANDRICVPDKQTIIFEPDWFSKKVLVELPIGTIIDERYRVIKKIANRTFSALYFVIHERLNRIYLLKVIAKRNYDASSYCDWIWRDTRVALEHPAIPKIIDIIENDDEIFVIEEYMKGMSLDAVLQKSGIQNWESVVEWAKQLCDVLGYLHTRKPRCVFRDVKPANIVLTPEGKVRLVDFDIMDVLYGEDEDSVLPWVSPRIVGTVGFAAPEQYTGNVDPRTDIYALGVTMHNLLTGIEPTHVSPNEWSVRQINPELPKWLDFVICKCIEIKPENRYQSCAELLYNLELGEGMFIKAPLGKKFFQKVKNYIKKK